MTDLQLHQTYPFTSRRRPNRLAVAAVLPAFPRVTRLLCGAVLLLTLGACVSINEQPESVATVQPAAPTVAVAAPDLALTAVEMADNTISLRPDHLALMAVIENQGTGIARNIPVRVTVSDETDQVLVESTQYVDELAAGGTTIVRFEQRTSIPTRSSYELLVEVVPADEETVTTNNVRAYDVSVDLR